MKAPNSNKRGCDFVGCVRDLVWKGSAFKLRLLSARNPNVSGKNIVNNSTENKCAVCRTCRTYTRLYAWMFLFWISLLTGPRKFLTSSGVQPKTLVKGPRDIASRPSIKPAPNQLPQSFMNVSVCQVFIGTFILTCWISTNPADSNSSLVCFGYRSDFPVRSVVSRSSCCHW